MMPFSRSLAIIAILIGSIGFLSCRSYPDVQPQPGDSARKVLQKAQTLNYDYNKPKDALPIYQYLIDNFQKDTEAIEDIVWAYYDMGYIYYRQRKFDQATENFNIVIDRGEKAKQDFSLIQDEVKRIERTVYVNNAVILAGHLLGKINRGETRKNGTYQVRKRSSTDEESAATTESTNETDPSTSSSTPPPAPSN